MARELPPDARHELQVTVAPEMAAPHLGPAGAVLSTPSMIGLMEQCCALAIAPFLDADERNVGVKVCITHDATSRVGDAIVVAARLVEQRGDRTVWDVATRGPEERRIGGGTIECVVVSRR